MAISADVVGGLSSFILWRSSSESNTGPDCGSRRYKETCLQHKMVRIHYDSWVVIKGKKQRLRLISSKHFQTFSLFLQWVNDTVENRTAHGFIENSNVWEWLSYSDEDRVAKLHVFSQQAAASCLLPSLHSASPHQSPAPTQSDTAHIKRNVTHKPRPRRHTAQTVLGRLVAAWGYIPVSVV